MSIFQNIKHVLKKSPEDAKGSSEKAKKKNPVLALSEMNQPTLPKGGAELRAFDRYQITDPALAYLSYLGTDYKIFSLSYGGIGITLPQGATPPTTITQGTLHILDKDCEIDMDFRHARNRDAGYQFRHQKAAALLFIRELVECLRVSQTLTEIDPLILNETYDKNYLVLRGEGPTDMVIALNELGTKVAHFLCTFLKEGVYFQFEYKDGHISTGQALPGLNMSPRMQMHANPELAVVRQAIFLCSGLKNRGITSILVPIIDKAQQLLPRKLPNL